MKRTNPSVSGSASDAPPGRLIEAAIQQIEEHGLGQLTVRGVAGAAGMNVAAVNYYFRSKEALVAAALEVSIQNMMEDTERFLAGMPTDPIRVFGELLAYYLEGALRYPRISKAHLYDAFVNDAYDGPFPKALIPVLHRLRDAVKAAVPGLESAAAGRRVVAALSAILFPASFPGLCRRLGAVDFPTDRASYVEEIAHTALAPVEPPARPSPNESTGRRPSGGGKKV